MTATAILAVAFAIFYIRRWLQLKREVARRREVEEQLRRSRDFYLTLFDDFPSLIWRSDATGKSDYVNRAWQDFTGLSLEESYGDAWVDLIHPDDRPRCFAAYEAAFNARTSYETEFRFRRHDGEYCWILDRGLPYYDLDGTFAGYIGYSHDISERVKTEQALRESEKRFRETLENIKLIAVRLDAAGTVTFCNDFFLDLVGWRREEVLGTNWFDRFVPPDQGTVKRVFYSSFASGAIPAHFQNDILTRTGERRFISWTNTVLRDGTGVVTGVMSIGEDVTERKRAENTLSRYQEELKRLTSELSLTEERERRRLATDLHDRIGQTLAFAKIRADSLRYHVSPEGEEPLREVTELLEQTIQDVRSLIFQISPPLLYEVGLEAALEWLAESFQKEHGFAVSFHDDGAFKPLGEEAKVTLFQVVRELLINAAKHGRPRQVRLSVQRSEGRIVICVEDDGAGFDVAQELAPPRSRSVTGFGLFSIRQRLEHLGGEIRFDSCVGRGTIATVAFPLTPADAAVEK